MIIRFAVRNFCGGFLYEKMAAWVNGETEGLVSFWVVHWTCKSSVTAVY